MKKSHTIFTLIAIVLLIFSCKSLERKEEQNRILSFENIFKLNPKDDINLANWGAYLEQKKKYKEALEKYQMAIDVAEKPTFGYYYHIGRMLEKVGKEKEAIAFYEQALMANVEQGNNNTEYIYRYLANLYEKYGDITQKEDLYRRATANDPTGKIYFFNWAITLMKLDRFDEAIEKCKKVLELDANYLTAYNAWWQALTWQNKNEEALELCKQVSELHPDYAFTYSTWGLILYKQGKNEEAMEQLVKAVLLNPADAVAWCNYGSVLFNLKHYEEAIIKYQKSLSLGLVCSNATHNLATSYFYAGKYDQAEVSFQKAVKVNPSLSLTYLNWGQMLSKQEKYKDAIKKFNKAIALSPDDTNVYYFLGETFNKMKQYDKAICQFERVVELKKDIDSKVYIGWDESIEGLKLRGDQQYDRKREVLKNELEKYKQKDSSEKDENLLRLYTKYL